MYVLKAIAALLFGGFSWYQIATTILLSAGLWGIYTKCGMPGWHALIPGYRYVTLGKCAVRELEGRVLCFIEIVMNLLETASLIFNFSVFTTFTTENETVFYTNLNVLAIGAIAAVFLMMLLYQIRIYIGLCATFGKSKKWIWLWIPAECLAALIWGFGKKHQPLWQVQDTEAETERYFSGARTAALGSGLTINIEERSVSDFFKKKYLLRDIHMGIQPGHMVLLLGGSGAGKTTFVNAVNGYEKAKAEVLLNGDNIYSNYKSMQYDIGFVPQLDLMRGNDTVLHTLLDTAALRLPKDFTSDERRARVDEVMGIFGLIPVKDNLVCKLSGGQRKRLSISMEYLSDPTLFILDEPDSGLDGVMARELMQRLREIANRGKIVIVITHTPDRVIDLFDDVIVLAKDKNRTGRLAYYGPIAEAKKFFNRESMEQFVKCVNRKEEGGDGLADEFIMKYAEVQHA